MGVLQGLVSAGGNLYAAWKGEPDDDRIFYSIWNGKDKWSPSNTIGGNTSAGPSLGLYNNTVYAAWKGEWSDPRLFFSKYNGSAWEPQAQIPNAYSDNGPALCQFGSTLVVAWKNVFDSSIYFSTYDVSANKWSAPAAIPGVGSSVGPSLASFGGIVYAAWKGEGSDQGLYYATYDQSGWHAQNPIPGVASSVGPSLSGSGDKLYAVWKGENTDETLYYAYYPSGSGTTKTWSAQTPIPGSGSSIGAAIAPLGANLYAMAKGKDADVSLYLASFGTAWSTWTSPIPGNTGPDTYTNYLPTPTSSGNDANYLLADSKGAPVTGATLTITVVEDIVPDSGLPFSIQMNCNSPAQASGANPFVWQQYGFAIASNQVFFWVNCYRKQDEPASPFCQWDSRPPRLPGNSGWLPLPGNTNVLPAGWQLSITLTNDSGNHINGFSFSITPPGGPTLSPPAQTLEGIRPAVTQVNLATIQNFQAVMVAENGGRTTDFSGGKAIILCYETNSLTASASQDETGEKGNISYSPLPPSYPNGEFYQLIGFGSV